MDYKGSDYTGYEDDDADGFWVWNKEGYPLIPENKEFASYCYSFNLGSTLSTTGFDFTSIGINDYCDYFSVSEPIPIYFTGAEGAGCYYSSFPINPVGSHTFLPTFNPLSSSYFF